MYYNNILETIGNTPVVKINRLVDENSATVLAKLEMFNPSGSIKDRIAKYMIEQAEKRRNLKPDSIIVEPTTGNTGISLSMVSTIKGYRMIAVMPEGMSKEREIMIKAYGAEILFAKNGGRTDINLTINKAQQISKENSKVFIPNQFNNINNIIAHKETTGKEILDQLGNNIDAFVAGVGTGGTLIGVAQALKEKIPEIRIIAVEPTNSAILSDGKSGQHKIQGIGEGFIPDLLKSNLNLIDEIITVTDEEAINTTRKLAKEEGILVGISSGANMFAALKVAKKLGKGKIVVTIFPDRGERYLSNDVFKS
ncbi:MAG: cysteine synthase A [Candidatus Aenigmarchaeota archaeon]|nr:cysteine synthase A [Candidatus Aenigmarchaeota archaeon]